jgi:mutator protein MutT
MSGYLSKLRELVGSRRLFAPGVRAIVVNEAGEILLQRRTDSGQWGVPGGAVELGESALEALGRELEEETSLTVLDAEPMALYSGQKQAFSYPNGDKIQCYAIAFIIRRWSGSPRPDGDEGFELRFFPLSELPTDMHEIHRLTLRDYSSYKGKFLVH